MNRFLELIKNNYKIILVSILAFYLGGLILGPSDHDTSNATDSTTPTSWTCSMHPSIKLPEKGQCPICFMDLIPLKETEGGLTANQITLSEEASQLASIQTVIVKSGIPTKEIHLSGKISYDETRVRTITAWVPGRLERLFVDYTGISVEKGDHMIELYSPDLYAAQEELIQARRLFRSNNDSGEILRQSAEISLNAAREKLLLMGLSENQILKIESMNTPTPIIEMKSPVSGVVITKNGVEGAYVKTGTPIYTIADLSQVWVLFDVYETDLPWIALGQEVVFNTESNPGKSYSGKVAFIEPIVSEITRTVQVRINIDNSNGELKPGMFTHGIIKSKISHDGKAINTELAGKWVCPMHPEVVEDTHGICSICKMDLVIADSLGIVHGGNGNNESILIPVSAVLKTGHRALVYVKLPNADDPIYESRVVELGARVGNYYIVNSGLSVGEEVVLNGNFKIDSAMQISGKMSMMNHEKDKDKDRDNRNKSTKLKVTGELNDMVIHLYDFYNELQQALGNDQLNESQQAMISLNQNLPPNNQVPTVLKGENAYMWKKQISKLYTATSSNNLDDINSIRYQFNAITDVFLNWNMLFDLQYNTPIYKVFCPMANGNKGGTWISQDSVVFNPYYGAEMLRCGTVEGQLN